MRFRLRTLMIVLAIVAAVLSWVGHEGRIVTKRRSLMSGLQGRMQVYLLSEAPKGVKLVAKGNKSRGVSSLRRWLGDEDETVILFLSPFTERQEAIEAFPEADIYVLF